MWSGKWKVENVKSRLECLHHYSCISGQCKVESVKWKVKSGVESGESGVDKRCDRNKTGRS